MDDRGTVHGDLRDLGDGFRRERLRRRLTIDQVSAATLLRPRIIEAIESGAGANLPAAVFTIGLVRTYGRFLKVDPDPYLAEYLARTERSSAALVASAQGGRRGPGVLAVAIPLVLIGLLAGLTLYLYQQYAVFVSGAPLADVRPPSGVAIIPTPQASPPPAPVGTAAATPTPPPTRIAAAPTAHPTSAPAPTSPPVPTLVPTATSIPGVHIETKMSDRVWIQVEADGKVVFSGIVASGDRHTWNANSTLLIWSGNAGAVDVTYNGKPLGKLGAPGEVVKVTWTATQ
jgi:cytoskeletal protein RodZ